MVRSLIALLVAFIFGWVVYSQFMGTPEEKEMGKGIIKGAKTTLKSVGDVLKHEKEKFDQGAYDKALENLSNVIDNLRSNAGDKHKEEFDAFNDLQQELNNPELSNEEKIAKAEKLRKEMQSLLQTIEKEK